MSKQSTSNTAQAMWIGIGSLFSFLFAIVSSAILSRYLTKTEYGTYKQVLYVYTTLQSVFTLGLPLAYSFFLPRVSKGEGKTLTRRLEIAFLALGSVFSLVLFFGADTIAEILKNPNLGINIKIFSPTPVLVLPTMGLQGILATYKKTIWNAIYIVATRILMVIFVALPVAFYRADCQTAVLGFVIASFISLIVAMWVKNIPYKGVKKEPCSIRYNEIFRYSTPLMIAGLYGIGAKAADQFFISRYYGQEVFADFANGSLELPFVSMVLSAGATVLLPVFSEMVSNKEASNKIVELWTRTSVKSALILYPLIVFFWFFASDTLTFLYGDKFLASAIYFRIMLVVNFFTVVPFYPIMLALDKTKEYARIHLVIFIAVWLLEYWSVITINSPYAITAISVLCNLAKLLLMFNVVRKTLEQPMTSMLPIGKLIKIFVSCISMGFVSWYAIGLSPFAHIKILSIGVGFFLFIGLTLLISKPLKLDYFDVVRPVLSKYIKI